MQTAARLLTKLAAGDWRGASLNDPWGGERNFEDGSARHVRVLDVPGSLTQGIDMYWKVEHDGARVRLLFDASGFEACLRGDKEQKWAKLLRFVLQISIRGSSGYDTSLPAELYGDGIRQVAAWMLARAVEWEPTCTDAPLSYLVLHEHKCIGRGARRPSCD